MNENLQERITGFFHYWRERHRFICNLNLEKDSHEANVLIWAHLDALSNLWAKHIGKQECKDQGKRIIFDTFLARYGGELFQTVSLPDIWNRVDQGYIWTNQKEKLKLPDDVCVFLSTIGGRKKPPFIDIEERCTRQSSDDWSLEDIINATLAKYPKTNRTELEEWLTLSRYGAIAYKEMRNAYIHEGRPGERAHDFKLSGFPEKPTYLSWLYSTPPIMGFKVDFMLKVLKQCIDEFEADALQLQKDPAPEQ
jgi:hypothetical protein